MVYYRILNIVPCAIQKVLVVCLFYIQWCVSVNPILLIYPSPLHPHPLSPLVTISLFSTQDITLWLLVKFTDPHPIKKQKTKNLVNL